MPVMTKWRAALAALILMPLLTGCAPKKIENLEEMNRTLKELGFVCEGGTWPRSSLIHCDNDGIEVHWSDGGVEHLPFNSGRNGQYRPSSVGQRFIQGDHTWYAKSVTTPGSSSLDTGNANLEKLAKATRRGTQELYFRR